MTAAGSGVLGRLVQLLGDEVVHREADHDVAVIPLVCSVTRERYAVAGNQAAKKIGGDSATGQAENFLNGLISARLNL